MKRFTSTRGKVRKCKKGPKAIVLTTIQKIKIKLFSSRQKYFSKLRLFLERQKQNKIIMNRTNIQPPGNQLTTSQKMKMKKQVKYKQ
jgi:hypothetical protein